MMLNYISTTAVTGTTKLGPGKCMTEQFNTSGRLYTFGCSMTQYRWPTWADIVGTCWNEFENWGRPGAGNQYIFNSVMECNARNKFNSNDTVLIMWSNISRIDYYQFKTWGYLHHKYPDKKNLDYPVCCPDGYEILSFAYMQAIEELLKSKKVVFKMMSWYSYESSSDAYNLYADTIEKINVIPLDFNKRFKKTTVKNNQGDVLTKELYDRLHGSDWPSLTDIQNNSYSTTPEIQIEVNEFLEFLKQDNRLNTHTTERDIHPTPLSHLKTVQNTFKNLTISDDTIKWIQDIDQKLFQGDAINFDTHAPMHRL